MNGKNLDILTMMKEIIKSIDEQIAQLTSLVRLMDIIEDSFAPNKLFNWLLMEVEARRDFLCDLRVDIVNKFSLEEDQ